MVSDCEGRWLWLSLAVAVARARPQVSVATLVSRVRRAQLGISSRWI